jgi:hypothetical protein
MVIGMDAAGECEIFDTATSSLKPAEETIKVRSRMAVADPNADSL